MGKIDRVEWTTTFAAGKEILLKAIVLTIPTYTVNYFRISVVSVRNWRPCSVTFFDGEKVERGEKPSDSVELESNQAKVEWRTGF